MGCGTSTIPKHSSTSRMVDVHSAEFYFHEINFSCMIFFHDIPLSSSSEYIIIMLSKKENLQHMSIESVMPVILSLSIRRIGFNIRVCFSGICMIVLYE